MLTRETKLGMVVAGSFLSLVGGVLGLKLWREPGGPTDPPAETAKAEEKPAAPTPAEPKPAEPAPLNVAQAPLNPPVDTPAALPAAVEPVVQPTNLPPSLPVAMPAPTPPIETPAVPPVLPAAETPKAIDPPRVEEKPAEMPKPVEAPPAPPITPPVETPKPVEPPPPVLPAEAPKEAPKEPEPSRTDPPIAVEVAPPAGQATLTTPPAEVQSPPAEPVARLDTPSRPPGAPTPLPDSVAHGVQPAGARPLPIRKAPANDNFLEEEYRIAPGDTFAAVSKRFYFSDKYAAALQRYNRDYPIASRDLKQDPPRLSPGTVVWIPPIRILERRYPGLTGGETAGANPNWNAAPGVRPVPSTGGYKTYRVRDGGETMQDIARRTLNNPNAWADVYRLNPTLNPSAAVPIPAGTLLRLPAEAKVE